MLPLLPLQLGPIRRAMPGFSVPHGGDGWMINAPYGPAHGTPG